MCTISQGHHMIYTTGWNIPRAPDAAVLSGKIRFVNVSEWHAVLQSFLTDALIYCRWMGWQNNYVPGAVPVGIAGECNCCPPTAAPGAVFGTVSPPSESDSRGPHPYDGRPLQTPGASCLYKSIFSVLDYSCNWFLFLLAVISKEVWRCGGGRPRAVGVPVHHVLLLHVLYGHAEHNVSHNGVLYILLRGLGRRAWSLGYRLLVFPPGNTGCKSYPIRRRMFSYANLYAAIRLHRSLY